MLAGGECAEPIVRIESLCKAFGAVRAVDDLTLSVKAGEFFALLGSSGCGKTSLLRLIAGLDRPDSGHIFIHGVDMTELPPHRRPVNMMFQSYALFPHMNVTDNVAFGLVQQGLGKPEIAARVAEMLRLVQLDGLERRRPDQLSGGQRQRVALARALARRPAILLLDEPLAALDKNLREETQRELVALQARLKTTFIVVTHDQREAMVLSQRLAVMRAGRFEQIGTPADAYERPANRYVAEFIGEINLIDGRATTAAKGRQWIETPAGPVEVLHAQGFPEGAAVTLALRPERLCISLVQSPGQGRGTNSFSGCITARSYRGEATAFDVTLGCGAKLRILRQNSGSELADLDIGAKVDLHFTDDAGIVFRQ